MVECVVGDGEGQLGQVIQDGRTGMFFGRPAGGGAGVVDLGGDDRGGLGWGIIQP